MKIRSVIGILLTLAGIFMYAAGYSMLNAAIDKKAAAEEATNRSVAECQAAIKRILATSSPSGPGSMETGTDKSITLDFGDVKDDPRRALADVTAVLAVCPTRVATELCLGTGCGRTGVLGPVKLTVKLNEMVR